MDKLNESIKTLKRIKNVIKLLDTKYKNKLIHMSSDQLKLSDLKNKNKIKKSRFSITPTEKKNETNFL